MIAEFSFSGSVAVPNWKQKFGKCKEEWRGVAQGCVDLLEEECSSLRAGRALLGSIGNNRSVPLTLRATAIFTYFISLPKVTCVVHLKVLYNLRLWVDCPTSMLVNRSIHTIRISFRSSSTNEHFNNDFQKNSNWPKLNGMGAVWRKNYFAFLEWQHFRG